MIVRPIRKRIWGRRVSEWWCERGEEEETYIAHCEHGSVEEEEYTPYEKEAAA